MWGNGGIEPTARNERRASSAETGLSTVDAGSAGLWRMTDSYVFRAPWNATAEEKIDFLFRLVVGIATRQNISAGQLALRLADHATKTDGVASTTHCEHGFDRSLADQHGTPLPPESRVEHLERELAALSVRTHNLETGMNATIAKLDEQKGDASYRMMQEDARQNARYFQRYYTNDRPPLLMLVGQHAGKPDDVKASTVYAWLDGRCSCPQCGDTAPSASTVALACLVCGFCAQLGRWEPARR